MLIILNSKIRPRGKWKIQSFTPKPKTRFASHDANVLKAGKKAAAYARSLFLARGSRVFEEKGGAGETPDFVLEKYDEGKKKWEEIGCGDLITKRGKMTKPHTPETWFLGDANKKAAKYKNRGGRYFITCYAYKDRAKERMGQFHH